MRKWIVLIAVLLVAGVANYLYIEHLRKQRNDARVEAIAATIKAEGLAEALAVKPREVTKLVPTLVTKTITKLIKEGSVQPVAAGHTEGKTTLYVPCPASTEDTTSMPIPLTVAGNFLITRIRFGLPVQYKAELLGSATMPDGSTQDLQFKDTKFDITVNKDIERALYDHELEGGWLKRHTALACPGVGLVFDPITKRVEGGVTCTYGFVWF